MKSAVKTAKLEINTVAQSDMQNIGRYLADNFAEDFYLKLKKEINNEFDNLINFPKSDTKVKSKKFGAYRFTIIKAYYIFYTYKNDVITIQRILHGSRNYEKLLNTGLSV